MTLLLQIQSALILSLLYTGLFFRKNKKRHVPIMLTAIIWDIILVLQIELSRGAIATASKPLENPAILNFHITLAVTTVLLYIGILISGRKLIKGEIQRKSLHMKLGFTAITLRTMTLITSYLIN